MTSESIFMKRVRGVLSDEESRWWRTYVISATTLAFCTALAFRAVHSGHSYWCWALPITYAGLWKCLYRCKQLLSSMAEESSSPALPKLSAEIHTLALSASLIILCFGIFFVLPL